MKQFTLRISVYVNSNQGDMLQVSEELQIKAMDFLDIAKILGQFHDLAQVIKEKQEHGTQTR